MSIFDSDSDEVTTPRASETPRSTKSSFRVKKSSKTRSTPRSPAVSASDRRSSTRKSQKVRLRHEDSQIQFEPIVSSPTNPFEQESQILTDRQKEMIDRQRMTANIFSSIGSKASSQSEAVSFKQPHEPLSDALSTDDTPIDASRTPANALADMGTMDGYLGSSPTPQARNRSQLINSDNTSVATPTAVRSIQIADSLGEIGSSPPQFEREGEYVLSTSSHNENNSFQSGQPKRVPESFDDGTTMDEEALLEDVTVLDQSAEADTPDDDILSADEFADIASSTLELELNAQINEELNAHFDSSAQGLAQYDTQEDSHLYEDAASHQPTWHDTKQPSTRVRGTQVSQQESNIDEEHADQSNTSRVGKSFSSGANDDITETPKSSQLQKLRRSSRHSLPLSPAQGSNKKKRKQSPVDTPSKKSKRGRPPKKADPPIKVEQTLGEAWEDQSTEQCIVVASSASPSVSKKKRSAAELQDSSDSRVAVPETARRQPLRRSTSHLKQVETISDDVLVKDTPAPKMPRKTAAKDISEARSTTPPQGSRSRTRAKRLSHVQVTPKSHRSSSLSSLSPPPASTDEAIVDETILSPAEPTAPVPGTSTASTQLSRPEPGQSLRQQIASQQVATATSTPNRSFTERVILTPRSIIEKLRKMVSDCKDMVLGRDEERELDDVMFDLRTEVHAAGRRSRDGA